MLGFTRKNDVLTSRLRDRLHSTGMTLGLLRLQLDAGQTEEARATMATIQEDFQLLLHGVDGELEDSTRQSEPRKRATPTVRRTRPNRISTPIVNNRISEATFEELHGEVCGV